MRLGIDLDGVVAQFHKGWMGRHAAEYGSQLTPSMVLGWNGLHELADFPDMDAFWTWFRNGDGPSSFRHLDPYPGALEALHRLAAEHDIVILTHKFDWAVSDTFSWLGDIGLPSREVHIREDKHAVDCDIYLDDSPLVLDALVQHRPDTLICRYVRPWNTPVAGATDVQNWNEFEALVTECPNGRGVPPVKPG
jgi:5'(3')-deoxyribonucleotidase